MKTRKRWLIGSILFAMLAVVVVSSAREGSEREEVVRHMHEHVQSVDAIRAAIIAGDLAAIREPAAWLANHDAVPGLPAGWQAFVAALRKDADRVLRANNLVAAAYATSRMALSCANCHRSSNVAIDFKQSSMPLEKSNDVAVHMRQHRWAADRMWEGLYGPSDKAWNAGTDMLLDVPIEPEEIDGAPRNERGELARMALEVHLIGSRGMVTFSPEQRSQLYSEFLSLCVDCHTTLERGPDK